MGENLGGNIIIKFILVGLVFVHLLVSYNFGISLLLQTDKKLQQ